MLVMILSLSLTALLQIWAQRGRLTQIDVANLLLWRGCVPMNEHSYAPGQTARHRDLLGVEQSHVLPTQLARCLCWEGSSQVGGDREYGTGNVGDIDAVCLYEASQQLAGCLQDGRRRICFDGYRSTDASTGHGIPPQCVRIKKKERETDGSTLLHSLG
jgi:hypothetical protein